MGERPDDCPRFTVSDYLALDEAGRQLVRSWLRLHDVSQNDVHEIVLLSPHMASIVRYKRPLEIVDDEWVFDVPLTFGVKVPFPVEASDG